MTETLKDLVHHKWDRENGIVQVEPFIKYGELRTFLIQKMRGAGLVTQQYYMNMFDLTEEDLK